MQTQKRSRFQLKPASHASRVKQEASYEAAEEIKREPELPPVVLEQQEKLNQMLNYSENERMQEMI